MIGDGGLLLAANHISNEQRSLIKDGFYRSFKPTAFQYEKTPNIDIEGKHQSQLEYACGYIDQANLYLMSNYPMLEPMMQIWQNSNECRNEIYYTHGDHLGSASWITNAGGKPIQYIHYAPYGELIANQKTIGYDERFKFTGKERDAETGYDYFGARFYDYRKGFWNSVDPLADKYPGNTPYLYCNGNPIMLVDPNGMWSINVSASENRGQNPYALFEVFDNNGDLLFRTIVKVVGIGGRDRSKVNADTPTGIYEILEWRATGEGTRYDATSYGPNDLLALDYKGTEGAGRNGIHVHGGRKQNELSNTKGCMRMADEDIAELKSVVTLLEALDSSEKGTTLEVQNTLSTPVSFKKDREDFKYDRSRDGFLLDEIVVTPNKDTL